MLLDTSPGFADKPTTKSLSYSMPIAPSPYDVCGESESYVMQMSSADKDADINIATHAHRAFN
jgi:hypothetical protein